MITVLRNPSYAKLFSAQVIALIGTGLLTVALGLLAFEIAGGDAGLVLGTAMTIKMIAYVAISPLTTALLARAPRKTVLIGADLLRAGVALALPFVSEAWEIYFLIFLLQSASATFTPTFQAVIPSVLPEEGDYTRALSLSRLAYDLEALLSPLLAAALLTVVSYHNLFAGTVVGFLVSAVLVMVTRFPPMDVSPPARFFDRLTRGAREFWTSRELRGLMGLNLVVSTATAMVLVNTVVLVQGELDRLQPDVALLLAAYGGGSMLIALVAPRLIELSTDRCVMGFGAAALPPLLLAGAVVLAVNDAAAQWPMLLVLWGLLGAATSSVLTPSARLLRRNSTEQTRPAVFAAQFSLSHACFLVTYPLAGILGASVGLSSTMVILACIGVLGALATAAAWHTGIRQESHQV